MVLDVPPTLTRLLIGQGSRDCLSPHFAGPSIVWTMPRIWIISAWTAGAAAFLIDRHEAAGANESDISDLLFEQLVLSTQIIFLRHSA